MGYPVRKQASQELFCRAAPTGFMYLLQKMPPGHQPKRWQTQGSVLERDGFMFPCLSDLAVWGLFPYNSFSQALQRPALLSPIYRRQRFKKRPIFFSIEFPALRGKWCADDVLQTWPYKGCILKASQARCKEDYWACVLDGAGMVSTSHKLCRKGSHLYWSSDQAHFTKWPRT